MNLIKSALLRLAITVLEAHFMVGAGTSNVVDEQIEELTPYWTRTLG